jgi:hypothetical protein
MNNAITPTVNDILNVWQQEQKISFFESRLRDVNREGIEKVIEFLRTTDFYVAPSSASYHSNYQGGLLDHSLLVYSLAFKYREGLVAMMPELEEKIPEDSLIISTLLHDICKTCFYKQAMKYRKDENNQWQSYLGYEIDDSFPIGHGEKSVIMLQDLGLQMTPEEMLTIRYHMGAWDGAMLTNDVKFSYSAAMNKYPMMVLVQSADNTSSLVFEKKSE